MCGCANKIVLISVKTKRRAPSFVYTSEEFSQEYHHGKFLYFEQPPQTYRLLVDNIIYGDLITDNSLSSFLPYSAHHLASIISCTRPHLNSHNERFRELFLSLKTFTRILSSLLTSSYSRLGYERLYVSIAVSPGECHLQKQRHISKVR